ncbi:MAG TPA: 3-oxoacyl-[acyl-carrier-protein] synthase III C-terminal domain-containing protein [Planctomycetota bacterium]
MQLARTPGASLAGLATAFPTNVVDQETTIHGLTQLFPEESRAFIRGLVSRSGVETRHISPSVPEVLAPSDFTQRNQRYARDGHALGLEATRKALARARLDPERVDVLIDVSCTGLTIPALDVALAQELGLRPDVRRIPITEAGCAAGALALGLGGSLCAAGQVVLIVAVELCALTLCPGDVSRTNLVCAALFGDGAAAALLVPGGEGPCVTATGSYLIPGSREAMGFDVGTHGLRILLQKELPELVQRDLGAVIERFLAQHGRSRDDLGLYLLHPGGRRILEAYRDVLGLGEEELAFSRESLRRYGNLSSVSVLTVLELALEAGFPLAPGKDALLMGVGPGLSLELALLSSPA